MKPSIRRELAQHVIDLINDEVITDDNLEDTHFHAFYEDFYVVGSYQSKVWLREHDVSARDVIEALTEAVIDYDNFDIVNTAMTREVLANEFIQIQGKKMLSDLTYDTVQELKDRLQVIPLASNIGE